MEEAKAPVIVAPTTKKRPLDYDSNSNYFKIRAVIRDLRPHFIQVRHYTLNNLNRLKIFAFS